MTQQYFINGIRLDSAAEHIETVRVRKRKTNESYLVPRAFVAHLINSGLCFKTRYKDGEDWRDGAEVEVIDGTFLRTSSNATAADNLLNLQKV
ncbi:DUF3892 domain-containing protein [Pseudomonas sp. RIT-To-2]|uniref:DUF3892 domain-containing protein n=1 Tax=Pseudomonas sp. RIT-To-2 TaxID=3462541 RepID=UPI002412F5D0